MPPQCIPPNAPPLIAPQCPPETRKAKQDLAAFKAEATAKMEAANKASAAADAKLVAQNAEYAELKRNMTTANNADLKVIADRMAVEKTEIEKLKNEIAKENGVLDSIQKDMANKAAEFKATQEKIKSDYQDKVAELAAENKKNTDALNDEEAKAQVRGMNWWWEAKGSMCQRDHI